ncbi:glutamine amidotransferase-related protein [Reinekea thalattae]|uniref:Type 1 glutamine amidotransferase n=1 Tax=Reinekea thalattae TaxID=2593301 RepID=A0A5C8ZAU4_9GAMM|nr:type 1 glutamine amidotransferase [Reinekea thalattae]TXR54887.1 type 1 glutamine amidotransferase [Reinekea thalattae]
MKVGIIVCGFVDPKLASHHGQYADMIQATLSPHGDFSFQLYDALAQQLPNPIDDCDGYILTGSVHDAHSDEDWVLNLIDWLQKCDAKRTKLVGICFGHQIIMRALGGTVERSNKGWGIGLSNNEVIQKPDWMTPDKNNIHILVSHQDQVTELPAEVETLATSDFCPAYMLAKDEHIITIQGHPEFSVKFIEDVIQMRNELGVFDDALYEQGIESLRNNAADSDTVMRWIARFLTH